MYKQLIQRKNLSTILFVAVIVFPALLLALLGFRSVWNEHLIEEKRYLSDLEQFTSKLNQRIEAAHDTLILQIHESAFLILDEYGNGKDLKRQKISSFAPLKVGVSGFEALFLFQEDRLVYPFMNIALETNLSDTFNITPENPAMIQLWQKMMQSYKEGQNALFLKLSLEWEQKLDQLPINDPSQKARPIIWKLRNRIFNENQNISASETELRRILKWVENHHSYISSQDISEYIDSNISDLLSSNQLENAERDFYWNLRITLQEHFSQSLIWEDLKDQVIEIFRDSKWNAEDQTYKVFQNHVLLITRLSSNTEGAIAVAVFEKKQFLEEQYQKLLPQNEAWNRIKTTFSSPWWKDGISPELEGWQRWEELQLPANHPFECITIWRWGEETMRKNLVNRSTLLILLLIFSLSSIVWGSWFFWRNHQKEKGLYLMKNNFMSSITHELKTPLTSIRMFAEMQMQGRVKNEEKMKEYSRLIFQDAGRLQLMVDDILAYSKMENTHEVQEFQTLPLSVIIKGIVGRWSEILQQNNQFIQSEIEEHIFIEGVSSGLESLVQNLIDNASKYSKNKCDHIQVRLYSQGNDAIFEVQDGGVGIPKSEQKKIFNIFYRVGDEMSRCTKGSGIGLAIVKKVADLHNAPIDIESQVGVGTTFKVKFKIKTK